MEEAEERIPRAAWQQGEVSLRMVEGLGLALMALLASWEMLATDRTWKPDPTFIL